ncbi:MAG: hypothetical protein WCK63_13930 [Betaproteobacteria bacterium]
MGKWFFEKLKADSYESGWFLPSLLRIGLNFDIRGVFLIAEVTWRVTKLTEWVVFTCGMSATAGELVF